MKITVQILISIILVTACTDPKKEKVATLKSDCITIHDEVMPRMGEIVELGSSIKDLHTELQKDTTDSALEVRQLCMLQVNMLDSAHEAMMQWMNLYVPDYDMDHNPDESIAYYESQKEEIIEVKRLMEKSIDDAEAMVDRAN